MDEFSRIEEMYDLERHETEKMVVFSGTANDYYTVIEFEEYAGRNYFMLKIGVELPDGLMNSEEFQSFTNEIHREVDPQIVEYRRKVFAVGAHSEDNFSEIGNRVADLLQFITANLKSFNVQTGDFFNAHDDGTIELYNIADSYFLLSDRSYEERKKENEEADKNTGVGHAFKGAIIGAIISILICIYLYSMTLVFGYRNFGWFMGLIITIFAIIFHRKNIGFVSKKSVLSMYGVVLGLAFFSILFVLTFDFTLMGYSLIATWIDLLFTSNMNFLYADIFTFFIGAAISSGILLLIYHRIYNKLSQQTTVIEKV